MASKETAQPEADPKSKHRQTPTYVAPTEALPRSKTPQPQHSPQAPSCGSMSGTSRSSRAARARAKAETAKARMIYVKEEAKIKEQRAKLDIALDVLQEEKKCAEAEAEASAYDSEEGSRRDKLELPVEDTAARTASFVYNANVEPFVPHQDAPERHIPILHPAYEHSDSGSIQMKDLSNFLLKRDLLVSRLTRFDDDPSNFHVWSNTFQNVTSELNVTADEEIDLLIKWLGPQSSKQAISLRTSNIHNPSAGLSKIWKRLSDRYGAPELIESEIKRKLDQFPKITNREYKRLYELSDILSEVESMKETPRYSSLFAYMDSSVGVNPIVSKLPLHLQNKWAERARRYKVSNNCVYPPFRFFVGFVEEMCNLYNDRSFHFEETSPRYTSQAPKQTFQTSRQAFQPPRPAMQVKKTCVETEIQDEECSLHPGCKHSLDNCREFRKKDIAEKRQYLREHGFCYKCCKSNKHIAKDCKSDIQCSICQSGKHTTALHIPQYEKRKPGVKDVGSDGGELAVKCTEVCEGFKGRSCAKVVLVKVFSDAQPEKAVLIYAILDDQSNSTLADTELLDLLGVDGQMVDYELASCSGLHQSSGRKVTSLRVQSVHDMNELFMPTVYECNNIPQEYSEIPTPRIASQFPHLAKIADNFPPYEETAKISLLIGRDIIEAHHVHEQIIGPKGSPFAQKLSLGWVIIGDVCLGKVHQPASGNVRVSTFKTYLIDNDRPSIFKPCQNNLALKEIGEPGGSLFAKTPRDEKIGLSIEDREFLEIMQREVKKSEDGHWMAPLPFRDSNPILPTNRNIVKRRALTLDANLKKDPVKRSQFVEFMDKVIKSGAAEVAPSYSDKVWYLPFFGVYHPRKPGKVRGVFDSSASCNGVSLNSVMLSGPNLTNSLLGILLRFRKDRYAIAADIEQMFYAFLVLEEHRDYLRFFWYRENDPDLELIEYRMRAHVFGNSPSPAVATYCLRRSVEESEKYGEDVKDFVNRNLYVDDGLSSVVTVHEGINLLTKTQTALQTEGKIRLHKIVSNDPEIMKAFPEKDLGEGGKSIVLNKDALPVHQSLGLSWDLVNDCFRFSIDLQEKPETRRGFISTLNSIFDPLGIVSPITIQGKLLMREISTGTDWDSQLDEQLVTKWNTWIELLQSLEGLSIPRMFVDRSVSTADEIELHIFCDASEKAVSAVAYLKTVDNSNVKAGFVMGKSKVSPSHGHTIPRLELCAACLATDLGQTIVENLDAHLSRVKYYTDSKVVLGYIYNKKRRFHNYVCHRVQRILSVSKSDQWTYVATQDNPADCGTRGMCSFDQLKGKWLSVPSRIRTECHSEVGETFPLVTPELDKEVRVTVVKTTMNRNFTARYERFSSWNMLVRAITILLKRARACKSKRDSSAASVSDRVSKIDSEMVIVRQAQADMYPEEVKCLRENRQLHKDSSILDLNPYLDKSGTLRVGGRLNKSCFPAEECNPIFLSGKKHVAVLVSRHCHELVKHQGRLLTEGAIRNRGYWIVGAKRLVSSMIHNCVQCRKLRGVCEHQQTADLPEDRLVPGPPFTSVGVDAFGLWNVVTRKTRGGMANSKRWAILFTCMTTRAVHLEVVEEMSSSSFINALRRFIALRGSVQQFRSDRGTNFVGATDDLQINAVNVEDGALTKFLYDSGVTWLFNPPHSSHMGGVWERMIGITRRILDGIFLENSGKSLTHEVLVTFMAEVSAIINSRPLVPISTDPKDPLILSPATLLNQKVKVEHVSCQTVDIKDIYKSHWKQVQVLSDVFWKRWRKRYLQNLQRRRTWTTERPNVENGTVVLLKDPNVPRIDWCLGIVTNAMKSEDGKVRKAEVRVLKNNRRVVYVRPVTEMVILVED